MKQLIILIAFLVSALTAFSASSATLKIATLSPEGSAWMVKFRAAAKEIKQRTDNRVKLKFYPGGVMGDDASVLKKIRIRQLHGGAMTGGSLARFYPDSLVYSLPVRFDDLQQVKQVRGAVDKDIVKGFEEGGFVTFGLAGGGFAYIMSKEPIAQPDDLKGRKTWAPSVDAATVAAFDAFSISPIPLPIGDVLASLQTGLIDTVATSPVGAITLQWHTQIKHVTKVPLIYVYAVMAIENKAFNKLSDEHQSVVREVIGRAFAEIDVENEADNEKALAALVGQGINIITPNETQMKAWKSLGQKAIVNMVNNGAISGEMVNKVNDVLSDD